MKSIGQFIVDIPGKIIDLLGELLKFLFIPEKGFFDNQVQEVRSKFAFADSLCGTAENIFSAVSGASATMLTDEGGSSAPCFTFDFSAASTHWDYGGGKVVVDFAWFEPWRDTVQAIIRAFIWVVFIINTYRDLPNIINGVGSAVKTTASAVGGDND